MVRERRRLLREPHELAALTHPLRLDLMDHLMAVRQATASECARAVGDTPSNCSYHLRVLERAGLAESVDSDDGRERPWRATATGFHTDRDQVDSEPGHALAVLGARRDHRRVLDYLARRPGVDERWRAVDTHASYTLRMTPVELAELGERLDALIRPYLAATRGAGAGAGDGDGDGDGTALVHLGVQAFPLTDEGHRTEEPRR